MTVQAGDRAFNNIAAIVFDKDGTLADSLPFLLHLTHSRVQQVEARCPGIQAELLKAFGLVGDRLDPAGLMAVGTRPDNEVAAAAYVAAQGHPWGDALTWVKQAFAAADQATPRKALKTPPLDGTFTLCQRLAQAGLKLALVSGDTTDHVQDFIDCYDLNPWFQLGLGSDGTWAKPDSALLRQTCEKLGVTAAQPLVIGDAQLDQQLATRYAGFISVTWGGSGAISGADAVLENPGQLTVS
ncbi:MAG: HAD family hydrolase [Leptolyngbyaceae cyanobacterium]